MKMEWPKDGPNENGMAQDGPKKGRKNPKNLEYVREIIISEKSSVWTGIITLGRKK